MSKLGKRLLGLAVIGGAIAGLAYYLKKSGADYGDDFEDDFEDDDFNLDHDLKSASERGYVSLNTQTENSENADTSETKDSGADADSSDA